MNTRSPAGSVTKQFSLLEKFSLSFIDKKVNIYLGNTIKNSSQGCKEFPLTKYFQHIGYISHIFLAKFWTYFGDAFLQNKQTPSRGNRTKFLREKLFWQIRKICRKTYQLRLHICKVSGIESATSLKKYFLQASRVFSGAFFQNFLNSFSGGYLLEAAAQRYSIKKVFSPNTSLNEKEKVLTFTL